MRKIVVLSFISLDGVCQAPGGPDEDTSGGFKYGGWTVPYFDEESGKIMGQQMTPPFDLLLGLTTYNIFAGYWPAQPKDHPVAGPFNAATKYVVSKDSFKPTWENSEVITGNVLERLRELKNSSGPMLQVHGSSELIQTLLREDLVDELWLKTFPITLGSGKKLFGPGTIPAAFELTSSTVVHGVIFANYKRAGKVRTGSFD
jgi:dihydrofolate reductase